VSSKAGCTAKSACLDAIKQHSKQVALNNEQQQVELPERAQYFDTKK